MYGPRENKVKPQDDHCYSFSMHITGKTHPLPLRISLVEWWGEIAAKAVCYGHHLLRNLRVSKSGKKKRFVWIFCITIRYFCPAVFQYLRRQNVVQKFHLSFSLRHCCSRNRTRCPFAVRMERINNAIKGQNVNFEYIRRCFKETAWPGGKSKQPNSGKRQLDVLMCLFAANKCTININVQEVYRWQTQLFFSQMLSILRSQSMKKET